MDVNTVKDAEKTLLASLMADSKMFYVVDGLIATETFYTTKHQHIYSAIGRLVKDDAPVDITTLRDALSGKVSVSELVEISGYSPTGANAEYYARIIADKHARRVAITAMRLGIEQAQGDVDIVDVIATVQRELDNTLPSSSGQASINPDIEQTLERVVDAKGGNFLPTGFSKLDRHASLRPGNLTLIAADPGAGKTSYLLCAARHMAKHGKRPLIFTLEMTREQILENLIAQELSICHQDMVNGTLNDLAVSKMMKRIGEFRRMNIGLVDKKMCGASIGKIRHRSIIEARTNGVDCIMIDSLTKVKMPENAGKYVTRLADVYNMICGDLVDLAEELDVPVIITHHLNKDGSKRGNKNKPTIQSLREAGDMWTHNVILIYRQYLHTKDKADENKAEFIVAKARDGRVGAVEAWFDGPTKTFGEIYEGGE